MNRHRILWTLQILLGIQFVIVGILHFVVPEGLPGPLGWMYDLSDTQHTISGAAEILGGIGLIVPADPHHRGVLRMTCRPAHRHPASGAA
ncbi:MAG: hypothetical protein ACLFWH_03630 [Actinomycetota bacterium]